MSIFFSILSERIAPACSVPFANPPGAFLQEKRPRKRVLSPDCFSIGVFNGNGGEMSMFFNVFQWFSGLYPPNEPRIHAWPALQKAKTRGNCLKEKWVGHAMVLIVMGPIGCGKTTMGTLLAGRPGWRFIEGDDFHPHAKVEIMRQGIPLTDRERIPWLDALVSEIAACRARGESAVLACPALKADYRTTRGRSGNSRHRLPEGRPLPAAAKNRGESESLHERRPVEKPVGHPGTPNGWHRGQNCPPPETIVELVVEEFRKLGSLT